MPVAPIATNIMERAIRLAEYFMAHERHLWQTLARTDDYLRDRAVYDWLARRPDRRATAREIQRAGVAGLTKADAVQLAMASMANRGWVHRSHDGKDVWT